MKIISTNTKLQCTDAIEGMKKIKKESVDMIFSDPPYFLSNDGYSVSGGKRVSVNKGEWDKSGTFKENYNFHKSWITQAKRVLKPNGTIWISGTYHSIYQCGFILQELGFEIINDISWFKPNAAPNIGCRCFTASHETIIWAKKSKKSKHIFNYLDLKNGNYHEKDPIKKENKQMRSVWSISTTPTSEKKCGRHPTQKPISLLERIVISSTNEGNTVLDPFLGSGTTAVVCAKNNRKFIGFDKDDNYIKLANKRLGE